MYEGIEEYIFISYSHLDGEFLDEIIDLFEQYNVRYWYDAGLNSGNDWNLVIAEHLEKASACLVLLSLNSSESDYVKNELNFAINHRIPIHTLCLKKFCIPNDIEMMLGRIHMLSKLDANYKEKLLQALPPDIFNNFSNKMEWKSKEHPLYEIVSEKMECQGTVSYLGKHKTLGYNILVQEERIRANNRKKIEEQAKCVSCLSNPLFPKIYDIRIDKDKMWTYQEYRKEQFLKDFLEENKLTEEQIIKWIKDIINGVEYLFSRNLGIQEFSRGNMVVLDNKEIGMFRLQNSYYGIFSLQIENKQYYFEKMVQEIAILLYQFCTGKVPVLPFQIIMNKRFSNLFLNKVNLIIQKSTREHNKIGYENFEQIKQDLNIKKIKLKETIFLKKRKAKLEQYESIKRKNIVSFTEKNEQKENIIREKNLEEEFGLEATAILTNNFLGSKAQIKLCICSTGQLMEFSKNEIVIGKDNKCDMILIQPTLSRQHARITKELPETYYIEDLQSINGVFIDGKRINSGERVMVKKKQEICLADVRIQIL